MSFEDRYRQALREQDSEDFALASLLAGGNADLTSFIRLKERRFVDGAGRRIRVDTYASRPDAPRAADQVAALFTITNSGKEAVVFSSARALGGPSLDPVSIAFRTQLRGIPPGGDGRIAVVLDRASLGPREGGKVALDFFSKGRGTQIEFSVDLVLGDFEAADESDSWWPFGRSRR